MITLMLCPQKHGKNIFLRTMIISLSIPGENGYEIYSLDPIDASRLLFKIRDRSRISSMSTVGSVTFISISVAQFGGKGGFGKLLRSQKSLGKNTTNFDSCRDLEGRKLKRTRREAKIESLKEKESESDKNRKVEPSEPKSAVMLDDKYIKQLAAINEAKQEAVAHGLKAVSSEPPSTSEPVVKKIKKTLFDDDDSD